VAAKPRSPAGVRGVEAVEEELPWLVRDSRVSASSMVVAQKSLKDGMRLPLGHARGWGGVM
jgi:hypothetical protein